MSRELLKIIEEVVAISKSPTPDGAERLIELSKSQNERVSVVASIAILAIGEGEEVEFERFTLLLDEKDLN